MRVAEIVITYFFGVGNGALWAFVWHATRKSQRRQGDPW